MLQLSDLQFQILTFSLELIGLSLAFIEVRAPKTAERIARFLGELAAPIEDLRQVAESGEKAYDKLSAGLSKLLNTVLTIGTIPLILLFAINIIEAGRSGTLSLAWLLPQLISFVIQMIVAVLALLLLSLVLYFSVVGGSDFATRFVEGRAVGTLGILLATVGLSLEFYQLISAI